MKLRTSVESPFGRMLLTEEDGRITRLTWSGAEAEDRSPLLDRAAEQLKAYFAGTLSVFDLALDPGTGAQGRFSEALLAIPFGETRTYGELGKALGLPAQAVGQHCGANPIPIIIPCHRVLGTGNLGGFSAPGGIETKVALLKHEGAGGLLI